MTMKLAYAYGVKLAVSPGWIKTHLGNAAAQGADMTGFIERSRQRNEELLNSAVTRPARSAAEKHRLAEITARSARKRARRQSPSSRSCVNSISVPSSSRGTSPRSWNS